MLIFVVQNDVFGLRARNGEGASRGKGVGDVIVMGIDRAVRTHSHGSRRWRQMGGDAGCDGKGFRNKPAVIGADKGRARFGMGVCAANIAANIAARRLPLFFVGEIRGEVTNEGIQGSSAKKLKGELPLLGPNKAGVGDDLAGSGLEGAVQFAETLLLAIAEQTMKIVDGACLVGDLVDVMVERLGILDGGGDRVVLVVKFVEKVVSFQPKFPVWPGPTRIVHHPLTVFARGRTGKDLGV